MLDWTRSHAARIAATAVADLQALVAVSSPSGDVAGAEGCVAVVTALIPDGATVERLACSTASNADDLLVRVRGTGTKRILLVGHVDTVLSHALHQPLHPDPDVPGALRGSGTIDMKGGDILALGVLRALAADRLDEFAEVALLLVTDEEWRTESFVHVERFAGWDACLCFEAGELDAQGRDAVVVRRKAAGTLEIVATGVAAHSGARPDDGRNALLALAAVARIVASHHDPHGPDRLTAVPTVLNSGAALNVVPAHGTLICDVRADTLAAFGPVMDAIPAELDGVRLAVRNQREWPGMDSSAVAGPLLTRAGENLGRPIVAAARGGASDASHFASGIPLTIDGLGPLGAGAHAPHEHVLEASLGTRAEVALAVVDALLRA